jgi:hypothetical protein
LFWICSVIAPPKLPQMPSPLQTQIYAHILMTYLQILCSACHLSLSDFCFSPFSLLENSRDSEVEFMENEVLKFLLAMLNILFSLLFLFFFLLVLRYINNFVKQVFYISYIIFHPFHFSRILRIPKKFLRTQN